MSCFVSSCCCFISSCCFRHRSVLRILLFHLLHLLLKLRDLRSDLDRRRSEVLLYPPRHAIGHRLHLELRFFGDDHETWELLHIYRIPQAKASEHSLVHVRQLAEPLGSALWPSSSVLECIQFVANISSYNKTCTCTFCHPDLCIYNEAVICTCSLLANSNSIRPFCANTALEKLICADNGLYSRTDQIKKVRLCVWYAPHKPHSEELRLRVARVC